MTQTLERRTERGEPRRSRRTGTGMVVLIVVSAIVLGGIFPFRQMLAQRRQVEGAEEKLAALVDENARLEQEIADLSTPAETERLAREQLGLVRPGEVGYAVETLPPAAVAPEDLPEADGGDRPFWQRIWDFLTGRDLEPDG